MRSVCRRACIRIPDKEKWVERDKEANELLYAETGLREGQIWVGPDGTSAKIGARGFVKGLLSGWEFAVTVTYPDGRKETTLTPAKRISDLFKKNGYEQKESQLSVGRNAAGKEPSERGEGTSDDSRGAVEAVNEFKKVIEWGKPRKSIIGRTLSEREATDLITQMGAKAEVAPAIELTSENWIEQFGEEGKVETPVGIVKIGENQFLKLFSRKRAEYFGMIHPTLNSPDVILEEADPKEGSERDSKYLFIKTFVKSNGTRIVHFESVTVKKDGMEVSISSHEIKGKSLKNKMQKDIVLHLDEKLSPGSEMRLTETPSESEGPDLVPTSDNVSSDGKDNTVVVDNQISKDAKRLSADESADKQTDGANAKPISSKNIELGAETQQPIEDFGEEIAGARKDMLRDLAKRAVDEGLTSEGEAAYGSEVNIRYRDAKNEDIRKDNSEEATGTVDKEILARQNMLTAKRLKASNLQIKALEISFSNRGRICAATKVCLHRLKML